MSKMSIEELMETVARLRGEVGVWRGLYETTLARLNDVTLEMAAARAVGGSITGPRYALPPMPPEKQTTVPGALLAMTLKQRAVILATLAGASYEDIAAAMGASQTTIKLHMKAALDKLGIESRLALVHRRQELLDAYAELGGEEALTVPADWFKKQPAKLMRTLAPTRSTLPPPGGTASVDPPPGRRSRETA